MTNRLGKLLLLGLAGCWFSPLAIANDFPTTERFLAVHACMRQHPGAFYEMLHKCACALDQLAEQLSYAEYVELSTIANAMTIAGERGNGMRDNESLKAPLARFKRLNQEADKACFLNPP